MSTLWLRAESKKFEKRTALTPQNTKLLIDDGIKVYIESSKERIFKDEEYIQSGAIVVEKYSWINAPQDAYILGIKELIGFEKMILRHKHIMFAHIYKNQINWKKTLAQFKDGGGILYDLEFLTHEDQMRIASFSFYAGFVGAHLALECFIHKTNNTSFTPQHFYPNEDKLIVNTQYKLNQINETPTVVISGANGKCGKGAIEYFKQFNINIITLDRLQIENEEYKSIILASDIFINCIYVSNNTPIILDMQDLNSCNHKLSVISDVSCDPTSNNNPLPFYNKITTFDNPIKKIKTDYKEINLIAIDHLPSFLPKMSSIKFSNDLFPHLRDILLGKKTHPWIKAEQLYFSKINEITN